MDLETVSLTALLRLQDRVSEVVRRRFGRRLALAFTDTVASTPHLARFGDEAGSRLQQRHRDYLTAEVNQAGGRIVDTAGDGAFACFPTVEAGAAALLTFLARVRGDNLGRTPSDELSVRASLHVGDVLTDGEIVSGEAVHLAARLGQRGAGFEILLSRDAFRELSPRLRLQCRPRDPLTLKGFADPVPVVALVLSLDARVPTSVRLVETGEQIPLPEQAAALSLGRLAPSASVPGNDIVLRAATSAGTRRIGRYHLELRRAPDGFTLRPLSSALTEVSGVKVPRGAEVVVRAGTTVRLSGVLTLSFEGPEDPSLATLPADTDEVTATRLTSPTLGRRS